MNQTLSHRLRAAVLSAAALWLAGCCTFSAPRHAGPVTEQFDGDQFVNPDPIEDKGFGDFLAWITSRSPGPWRSWTAAAPGPPPPERVGNGEMRVTFVNHATVLVQFDGLNVLTDPVWSNRVGPKVMGMTVGVGRRRPPGLRFEDLPPIDVVVISHNHYDHFDLPTLRRLHDEHRPRFFVGQGMHALLERNGITGGTELAWWQSVRLNDANEVVFTPSQHFSGRGLCDRNANQWGSWVITSPSGALYFAGDTGWGSHFEKVGQKYGPIRLAVLPIGAFRPVEFMHPVHISPREAVEAHEVLGAHTSVAIHFGTFKLADDGQGEPKVRLDLALARRYPAMPRFWVLDFGEGRMVPPLDE